MAAAFLQCSLLLAIIAYVLALSASPATAVIRPLPITKPSRMHPLTKLPPSILVTSVCHSNIIDPKICLSILSSPEANGAKDMRSLALVVLKIAGKAAEDTNAAITAMLKSPQGKNSPAFRLCAKKFEQAANSFTKMIPEELEIDPMTANYDIKVNTDLADECDRAMADGMVVEPTITAGTKALRQFSLIGFEVTRMLRMDGEEP